ncbi:MAG: hypothetical protein V4721_00360 [Bacteroidota bacterium]
MCKELDKYLTDLQAARGAGAITAFAKKVGVSRIGLWRYRTGKQKPNMERRKKIQSLTLGVVKTKHFITGE